jgi:hypothetical protein
LTADRTCFAQIIEIAQCYPPQLEEGEYPGREFVEAPEESASSAPIMSHASSKCANVGDVDRVEDSEELGARSPSSGDDDDAAIPPKPLDSTLLFERGRKFFQTLALTHRKLLFSNLFLTGFVLL